MNMKKDNGTGVKYLQIAEMLERDILTGKYQPGDKLPSERKLASHFEVAHLTLRQAMRTLIDKQLIESRHGKGNFIGSAKVYNSYIKKKKKSVSTGGIVVLGMHVVSNKTFNPVNLSVSLLRYRGIVESAFMLKTTVQTLDLFDYVNDRDWMLDRFKDVQGFILLDKVVSDDVIVSLAGHNIQVVLLSASKHRHCNTISIDAYKGVFEAVNYLINEGHKRIGFIGCGPKNYSVETRFRAYCSALGDAGLEVGEDYIIREDRGLPEDGERGIEQLMKLKTPPTAIVTSSDYRAIGILRKAALLGVKVPGDLRVIGYDDIPEAAIQKPALSTIHNPLYETGYEAVRMICRKAEEDQVNHEEKCFDTKLILRES